MNILNNSFAIDFAQGDHIQKFINACLNVDPYYISKIASYKFVISLWNDGLVMT